MKTFTQWLETWDGHHDEQMPRRPHNFDNFMQTADRHYTGSRSIIHATNPPQKSDFTAAVVDATQAGLTIRQIIRVLKGKTPPGITRYQYDLLRTVNDNFLILKKIIPTQDVIQILKTVAHQTQEAPKHPYIPETPKQDAIKAHNTWLHSQRNAS